MKNPFSLSFLLDPSKRRAMQEAIDIAWQSTDPEKIAFQNQMFPQGKPTVGQFILKMKTYAIEQTFGFN